MKTLFINGTIVPMKEVGLTYKYLGINNNKICYLGNEYPIDMYHKIIDLNGKFIYPTLTDSHLHLLYSIILSACSFNICEITKDGIKPNDLQGIKNKIKEYIKNNPKNKFIVINQYIPSAIKEGRLPYSKELDEWTNNLDVVIFNIDGHSASLSTSLLNKLSLESSTGILTGASYDMNQGKITNFIASKVDLKVLAKGIGNFTNECIKYGITKVCALDGEDNNKDLKDPLLSLLIFISRRLDIDVRLFPQYMNTNILKKLNNKLTFKRIGGCSKWELDGSVESHSASFKHPYLDNTITKPYYDNEYLNNKVKEILESNTILTTHAIGTNAIEQIVNAYKVNKELIPLNGPYTRIDHFEFPTNESIEDVSKMRIAVTFQPGYSYLDKRYINSYTRHLSKEDLDLVAPLKTIIDKGILILGSSDSPVQSVNPYDQMLGMVDYYKEEESISNYESFKTYTTNSSIALDEDEGILDINKNATFFISKYDILNISKNELNQVTAEVVYKNGKVLKNKKGTILELIKTILKIPHKI